MVIVLLPCTVFANTFETIGLRSQMEKADSLRSIGSLKESIEYYSRCGQELLNTGDSLGYMSCQAEIALSYYFMGNDSDASTLVHDISNVELKYHGEDSLVLSDILVVKGYFFLNQGLNLNALEAFGKALTIRKRYGFNNPLKLGEVLRFIGDTYLALGFSKMALNHFSYSLDYYKNSSSSSLNIGVLYTKIGNVHGAMGSYNLAEEFYKKSIDIYSLDTLQNYVWLVAGSYLNISSEDTKRGLYTKALVNIRRGIKMISDEYGKSSFSLALYYNNLGYLLEKLNKLDEAIYYLNLCKKLVLQNRGDTHRLMALSNTTLGIVHLKLGFPKRALKYHEEALRTRIKLYGPKHSRVAWSYNFIGETYETYNMLGKALETYNKAIQANLLDREGVSHRDKTITNIIAQKNEYYIVSLLGIARVYEKLSLRKRPTANLESSLLYLNKTAEYLLIMQEDRLNQSDKLFSSGIINSALKASVRICLKLYRLSNAKKYKNLAFIYAEQSKSITLREVVNKAASKGFYGIPEDVWELESSLKVKQNYLRSKGKRDDDSEHNEDLFSVNRQLDSLQIYLKSNYSEYYESKYNFKNMSVKEVQKRLNDDELLLEFFEGDSASYVFCLSSKNFDIVKIDASMGRDEFVSEYRAALKASVAGGSALVANQKQLSYKLYQHYMAPIHQLADSTITRLIIVPDGKTSYIPFDILLTSDPEPSEDMTSNMEYVLHQFSTQYAYSANLLFRQRQNKNNRFSTDFIGFAPSYLENETSPESLGRFRNQIVDLKYNQPEILSINKFMEGKLFQGGEATEANFKESLQGSNVIHLAMHALVDDEDPMDSRLVFTANQDTVEDNYLHAFELYNMEIPADLVVLSACETGFGKLQKGEGVMSLARAFAYAGCPSVVMSHWAVNDATTAKLMELFYKHLANGLEKDKALQQAKLEFLETADRAQANPYFWGSFVVMGDVSPIQINRPLDWRYVLVACLFFSLLILVSIKVVNQRQLMRQS